MAYFFCFIFLLVFFISKEAIKNPYSRLLIRIFSAIWCVVFFLSILNVNNLYAVTNKTYSIVGFGVISLLLGLFLGTTRIRPRNTLRKSGNDSFQNQFFAPLVFGRRITRVLYAYILLFYFLFIIYVVKVFSSGFDIYIMRLGFNSFIQSTVVSALFDVLVRPGFLAIALVSPIYIVHPSTREKALPFLITTLLLGIVGIGRVAFVFFFVDIIIFYSIFIHNEENSGLVSAEKAEAKYRFIKKTKRIIRYMGLTILVLLVIVTNMRSTGRNGFLSGLYSLVDAVISYLIGPLRAFEIRADQFIVQNGNLNGSATLAGLNQLVFSVKAFLGFGGSSSYANDIIGRFTSEYFLVGDNTIFNYALTLFFIPYIDFGIVGTIVIPLFGGYLIGAFCKRIECKLDISSMMIYLFIAELLYYSVFAYRFQSMSCTLLLLFLIVVRFRPRFR